MLVFNTARWHKENVAERLVQYLRDNYSQVQLCEQDAMNAVFGEQWGRLNARWNVLPFMNLAREHALLDRKSHAQLLAQAWLLHFCGRTNRGAGAAITRKRIGFSTILTRLPGRGGGRNGG